MVTVAGFSPSHTHARKLLRENASQVLNFPKQPFYAVFRPTNAELYGRGERSEPVIRFSGHLDKVVFNTVKWQENHAGEEQVQPFPFDEVSFDEVNSPEITVDYQLNRDQQKDIVDKGYFLDDFSLPQEPYLVDLEFTIDLDAEVLPGETLQDAPVVLIHTGPVSYIETDFEKSEYDMVEPIPNFYEMDTQQTEQLESTTELSIDNAMFAEDEFGERQGETYRPTEAQRARQSAAQRLYELSGGELDFTAEELLDRMRVGDDELRRVMEAEGLNEAANDQDRFARDMDKHYRGLGVEHSVYEPAPQADANAANATATDAQTSADAHITGEDQSTHEQTSDILRNRHGEDKVVTVSDLMAKRNAHMEDDAQKAAVDDNKEFIEADAEFSVLDDDVEIDFDDVEIDFDGTELDSDDLADDLADEVDIDGEYVSDEDDKRDEYAPKHAKSAPNNSMARKVARHQQMIADQQMRENPSPDVER